MNARRTFKCRFKLSSIKSNSMKSYTNNFAKINYPMLLMDSPNEFRIQKIVMDPPEVCKPFICKQSNLE
jgi:hypothetical protein